MRLWLDIESRSPVPIKRGVHRYSTKAEILLLQWAVDDGPVHVDDLTAGDSPKALIAAARQCTEIWSHGEFDDVMMAKCAQWWMVPDAKWRNTMALARMHGLPGGLDKLSTIFKLGADEAKDLRGKALIQLFCVPDKKTGEYCDRKSHPKEWAEFKSYGAQDIVAMRAIWRKCPHWNDTPRMWAQYHLDRQMNDRGVAMDLDLAISLIEHTDRAKARYAKHTSELTVGEVESPTQRARLLTFLKAFGVDLPDLTADTVARRLEDESLPETVKELLRARQQASKNSAAKCKRILESEVGGRLNGLLVFCGAARTGRWAGRLFQPQNLPRPKHEQDIIDFAIEKFKDGSIDDLEIIDGVMSLASSTLRGLMVAALGHQLVVSDLANIEGRILAWLAGEKWKLDAFRAFDAKTGPDLYKVAYARAFGIDPNSIGNDDPRRQIGKVMELALGYYGGVGAFLNMAEVYGLDLEALAKAAWKTIPLATRCKAEAAYRKRGGSYGLPKRTWIVCQALVYMWREAHPQIVKFWHELEAAAKAICAGSKHVFPVGNITLDGKKNWLRMRLPSGRYLCYPAPREQDGVNFLGVDPYTKQWKRISTYSGKLAENLTQAAAADVLMDGLLAAGDAGMNPVLSVHDEIICEVDALDGRDDKDLSLLMTTSSPWAKGLPLAAKGFTAQRYRK